MNLGLYLEGMKELNQGPEQPVIELQDVSRVYGHTTKPVYALNHVSLELPSGITFITGPSGCGKSTLINLLGALDRPDSGRIRVADTWLSDLADKDIDEYRRHTVGIVFQFFHLIPTLTILENVSLPAELAGIPFKQAKAKAETLLERVDLLDRVSHRPHELSGGEIQRTAIARALINDPAVILADEPTGNLDSTASHRVMTLFRTIAGEGIASVLIASHDREMFQSGDRVLKLRDGKLDHS